MADKADKTELEQLLSSYIDGACSEREREQVEAALRRDPQLRALHAQLRHTAEAIEAVPREAAPGHVRDRILAQLERRALLGVPAGSPGRVSGRGRSTGRLTLLAAAMLVAAVGAAWWYRTQVQPKPGQELALAPAHPEIDAVRKTAPQEAYEQSPAATGANRSEPDMQGLDVLRPATPPAAPMPALSAGRSAARLQEPILADRAGGAMRSKQAFGVAQDAQPMAAPGSAAGVTGAGETTVTGLAAGGAISKSKDGVSVSHEARAETSMLDSIQQHMSAAAASQVVASAAPAEPESSMQAEQPWLEAARQFVAWAVSGQAATTVLQSGEVVYQFNNVPRLIPHERTSPWIDLQPAPGAAFEPASR